MLAQALQLQSVPPQAEEKHALMRLTKGRRVLMIGGQGERGEHIRAYQQAFEFGEFEWVQSERTKATNYNRLVARMRPGRYDYVIYLTRFIGHTTARLLKTINRAKIPLIYIKGGYSVAQIGLAIMEQCPRDLPHVYRPEKEKPIEMLPSPPPQAQQVSAEPVETPQRAETPEIVRASAKTWLNANPEKGFVAFKEAYPQIYMDHAFWAAHRRVKVNGHSFQVNAEKKENSMSKNNGSTLSKEGLALKKYIESLTDAQLKNVKYEDAKQGAGVDFTKTAFYNRTFAERRRRSGMPQRPNKHAPKTKPKGRGKAHAMNGKAAMITLAEISMDEYKGMEDIMEKFALRIIAEVHPDGRKARIVRLASPNAMEIRVPA